MTEVKNGEVKINNKNMLIGLVLMVACVYVGAITTMPHQSEIITTAVNIPAQFSPEPQQAQIKEETVTMALNSNMAVINAVNLTTMAKIIVIVSIASIVFILLSTTGLIPRFGGES